jgi:hypothetical protein
VSAASGAFGIFSTLFFIIGLLLAVFASRPSPCELAFWLFGYACWFIVIFTQGIGMSYSRFGDVPLPENYNILSHSEFMHYWQMYMNKGDWPLSGYHLAMGVPFTLFPSLPPVNLYAYNQPYFLPEDGTPTMKYAVIGSCAINWTKLIDSGRVRGANPCNFEVNDGDADDCIGDWSATALFDYWCEIHEEYVADLQYEHSHTVEEGENLRAVKQRLNVTLNSMSCYYQENLLFVALGACAFVLSLVGIIASWRTRQARYLREGHRKPCAQLQTAGRTKHAAAPGPRAEEPVQLSEDSESDSESSRAVPAGRRIPTPAAPRIAPRAPDEQSSGGSRSSGYDFASDEAVVLPTLPQERAVHGPGSSSSSGPLQARTYSTRRDSSYESWSSPHESPTRGKPAGLAPSSLHSAAGEPPQAVPLRLTVGHSMASSDHSSVRPVQPPKRRSSSSSESGSPPPRPASTSGSESPPPAPPHSRRQPVAKGPPSASGSSSAHPARIAVRAAPGSSGEDSGSAPPVRVSLVVPAKPLAKPKPPRDDDEESEPEKQSSSGPKAPPVRLSAAMPVPPPTADEEEESANEPRPALAKSSSSSSARRPPPAGRPEPDDPDYSGGSAEPGSAPAKQPDSQDDDYTEEVITSAVPPPAAGDSDDDEDADRSESGA